MHARTLARRNPAEPMTEAGSGRTWLPHRLSLQGSSYTVDKALRSLPCTFLPSRSGVLSSNSTMLQMNQAQGAQHRFSGRPLRFTGVLTSFTFEDEGLLLGRSVHPNVPLKCFKRQCKRTVCGVELSPVAVDVRGVQTTVGSCMRRLGRLSC